jgi:ribulose-phosphate 3-epimerase
MSIWDEKCIIAPSLIGLDMCNLESQIRDIEAAGLTMLHIDILDGRFSPSMPLGLETVRQLREKTGLAFDAHLMVTEPDYFVNELIDIGVQQIIFHGENVNHVDGMLNRIKARGIRTGVALKPSTPLYALEYILEKCDTVLLMLINPGYADSGSENQVTYAERKIRELRTMIQGRNLSTKIEIDGRVSPANIEQYAKEGTVDIFVVGSVCINRHTLTEDMRKLKLLREKYRGQNNDV